jgi:hypothetical protein
VDLADEDYKTGLVIYSSLSREIREEKSDYEIRIQRRSGFSGSLALHGIEA